MIFVLSSLPWAFLIFSTLILLLIPWMHKLSADYEQESHPLRILINVLLIALVMHHVISKAYSTSGLEVLAFASSGFLVSWLLSRPTFHDKTQWPVLPFLMACVVGAHGLFDGIAFRLASVFSAPSSFIAPVEASAPDLPLWSTLLPFSPFLSLEHLSAITLALAVMLHRIPESLLIWKLTSKLISSRAATFTLLLLATSTVLGFALSIEVLSHSRPLYIHLSYLQVFIAGSLLHATWHHYIAKQPT